MSGSRAARANACCSAAASRSARWRAEEAEAAFLQAVRACLDEDGGRAVRQRSERSKQNGRQRSERSKQNVRQRGGRSKLSESRAQLRSGGRGRGLKEAMTESEFLAALREREGLRRAVLQKIVIDTKLRGCTFEIVTDRAYSSEDERAASAVVRSGRPALFGHGRAHPQAGRPTRSSSAARSSNTSPATTARRRRACARRTSTYRSRGISCASPSASTRPSAAFSKRTRSCCRGSSGCFRIIFAAVSAARLRTRIRAASSRKRNRRGRALRLSPRARLPRRRFSADRRAERAEDGDVFVRLRLPEQFAHRLRADRSRRRAHDARQDGRFRRRQGGAPVSALHDRGRDRPHDFIPISPAKKTADKIRALQAGDSVVCTGANELYNGRLSYTARYINRGAPPADFVPEKRAGKALPLHYGPRASRKRSRITTSWISSGSRPCRRGWSKTRSSYSTWKRPASSTRPRPAARWTRSRRSAPSRSSAARSAKNSPPSSTRSAPSARRSSS